MADRQQVEAFIANQQSLHLYEFARIQFVEVLAALSQKDFETVTHNLILMVLHEGAIAQVMHFEPTQERFKVLQLTVPKDIPANVFQWVIAHEFGHVMQGRSWRKSDGHALEDDATEWAKKWGFEKTEEVRAYLGNYTGRSHVK